MRASFKARQSEVRYAVANPQSRSRRTTQRAEYKRQKARFVSPPPNSSSPQEQYHIMPPTVVVSQEQYNVLPPTGYGYGMVRYDDCVSYRRYSRQAHSPYRPRRLIFCCASPAYADDHPCQVNRAPSQSSARENHPHPLAALQLRNCEGGAFSIFFAKSQTLSRCRSSFPPRFRSEIENSHVH